MKKLLFLFFILVISTVSFSQENTDSVDIRKIVADQITKAREANTPVYNEIKEPVKIEESSVNISMIVKMGLILSFIMWWVLSRPKKQRIKKVPVNKTLPANNIQQIKKIRAGLKEHLPGNIREDDITKAARELQIGKGELYLAALLKAQEMKLAHTKGMLYD